MMSGVGLVHSLGACWLAVQGVALLLVLSRLMPGRVRRPPVRARHAPRTDTTVTVVVASLNEAARIGPCLVGLQAQLAPLLEVLVVDSRSTDGTRELVQAAGVADPRIQLLTDDPLPRGWVGKVWALETGLRHARGEWVLGIDADTVPAPGLVGAVVDAMEQDSLDVASFAPRFIGQSAGERFVQPAMLVTLIYRCGATGVAQPPPDRVLANGQCFMARRSVLVQHGGYVSARESFCDDVTLARHLASRGARVGFLDGSRIIAVHSYATLSEMWREWGRSFDLKDATPRWRRWIDVVMIWSVQALPVPMLLLLSVLSIVHGSASLSSDVLVRALLVVNASALLVRLMLLTALRGSYAVRGAPFWLSWLADVPAAWRLTLSTVRVSRSWRGRQYDSLVTHSAG